MRKKVSCDTLSSTIWLCSIAIDKVLVEKEEKIEKLSKEKQGKLLYS